MSDFLCMYCGLILKNRLEGQMHEDGHRSQITLNKEKEPVMTDKRISCFNMIKTHVGNKPTVHTCKSVIFKTNSNDANSKHSRRDAWFYSVVSCAFEMASRYITWTVAQLKKELMQRDAATHGRKTDLIQRYELVIDIFTPVSLKIL